MRGVVVRGPRRVQPWVVFTCGAMGAGKGYTLHWLSKHAIFPLEDVVQIDVDYFKRVMPEWRGYIEAGQRQEEEAAKVEQKKTKKGDAGEGEGAATMATAGAAETTTSSSSTTTTSRRAPNAAGSLTHKESGFIAEIAQELALRSGQNIWIDGSLQDHAWWSGVFADIRKRFPRYRLAIFYVYASEAEVLRRAEKRGRETGRFIPEQVLKDSMEKCKNSVKVLSPLADFLAIINNEKRTPQLDLFEDRSRSFTAIYERFVSPATRYGARRGSIAAEQERGGKSSLLGLRGRSKGRGGREREKERSRKD